MRTHFPCSTFEHGKKISWYHPLLIMWTKTQTFKYSARDTYKTVIKY